MQTVLSMLSPTPIPPPLLCGLVDACKKEPPLTHSSIFILPSAGLYIPHPQSLGRPKVPLQEPPACLWPCAQNSGGSEAARGQEGERERAVHPPRSPHLGGGPVACFPEFLTHVGLNTICEAVM